jgi:hypothetical protein
MIDCWFVVFNSTFNNIGGQFYGEIIILSRAEAREVSDKIY